MKPFLHTTLRLILTLVALGSNCLLTVGAAETNVAPIATPGAPNSAERMRTVYLGLVRESIVPADPRVIASAALAKLAALAPERVLPLPAWFGVDAERDAAWLAERVVDLPPPWLVLDAMARAAATAHVLLRSPQRREGIGALMAGKPRAAPGFNLHPLADGRLVVFDVFPGASAEASGLRVGDVLHRIDGVPAARVDVFLLNAHPAGVELKLDIERAGRPATIVLRLIQADVPSVESRLLDGGIGYVVVRWFARSDNAERDTAGLARRAFIALASQDARGLIIDLRSALGGSGEVAMASALCDGDVMYSIQQPLSAPVRHVKRKGERIWPDRPIVVLVNEHTVSAGEDLALSLRELAHAKIVGRTTGGGLTEMTFVPLADGYALTIPNGVVLGPISGKGQPGHAIKPDIEAPNQSIAELLNGRDPQLEAARAVLANNPALSGAKP
jgi:C-terminal processing protease CtpA/Prc